MTPSIDQVHGSGPLIPFHGVTHELRKRPNINDLCAYIEGVVAA